MYVYPESVSVTTIYFKQMTYLNQVYKHFMCAYKSKHITQSTRLLATATAVVKSGLYEQRFLVLKNTKHHHRPTNIFPLNSCSFHSVINNVQLF